MEIVVSRISVFVLIKLSSIVSLCVQSCMAGVEKGMSS